MNRPPSDWESDTLKELCLPITKTDPIDSGRESIRYIDIGTVDGATHSLADVPEIPAAGAPSRCRQVVQSGDTVFSTVRPYLEKIAYVDESLDGEFASTGFCVLRPGPRLNPRFLYYFSTSRQMLDQVLPLQKGVSYPAVLEREVQATEMPVPPLDEQRRIVDIFEDHLSRLDAAERSLERSDSSAKALVRAVLQSGLRGTLVTDDLSEGAATDLLDEVPSFTPDAEERVWPVPETWAWARIGDLFEVNVGATPSRATAAHWSGDLPWVSSGEVAFGRISSTREHITREAAGNPVRRVHPPGTVMLAMIGEGRTRGQAAILDIEAAHNQNCASIRVSATKVLPEYIYGYLEERYLETRRGGSGGQQPALNKAAIQRFPVPIAPLGTQRRLVEAWTEARDAAERLEHGIQAATLRRSTLRRALLEAAFAGRLTGGHADLSAAEERIGA